MPSTSLFDAHLSFLVHKPDQICSFASVQRLRNEVLDQACVQGPGVLVVRTRDRELQHVPAPLPRGLARRPDHGPALVPIQHVVHQHHDSQVRLCLLRVPFARAQEAQELTPVPQARQLHVQLRHQSLVHLQDVCFVVNIYL